MTSSTSRFRSWSRGIALCLVLCFCGFSAATRAQAQEGEDRTDELEEIALFSEVVQLALENSARDVSFVTTGLDVIKPNDMVWLARPGDSGITAIACRPILDTAKAGEILGQRGRNEIHDCLALDVTNRSSFALSENGSLIILRRGWADSIRVGTDIPRAADISVGLTDLIYVLWGEEVVVYTDPPAEPLWRFVLPEELLPAVAISASGMGEVFVAGQGARAVQVMELNDDGDYVAGRFVSAQQLGVEKVTGMSLTPKMLLPVPGREGWVDEDRFVFLSDADSGRLLALESQNLKLVGTYDARQEVPFSAPGRLDVSNRGQIVFVDQRSGAAHVLPTRLTVAMVEGTKLTWRIIEKKNRIRVQGGAEPKDPHGSGGH